MCRRDLETVETIDGLKLCVLSREIVTIPAPWRGLASVLRSPGCCAGRAAEKNVKIVSEPPKWVDNNLFLLVIRVNQGILRGCQLA